jgi:hypothetical protein
MKKITLLIAALAVGLPAAAQQPAKPAPAQEPAKVEAPPAPMAKAAAPKKNTPTRRTEDARQCLEKASNTEIIKCAEEFL